jgi:alkylation response protein AidB-like acyl-CoA dehydrogenase
MYSFEPNEEQQMLIDVVKRFAENDLRPAAHDADEDSEFPQNLIQKGWELGILQASVPEEYGGFGDRSILTSILACEELGWGDMAGALAIMVPSLFAIPILLGGTEEQKKKYLPSIVEADWKPYTAALLEYDFDFDVNELDTIAKLDKKEYVLNGEKSYVPFADQADAMVIYANLDGKTQGFILEKDTDGVSIGERAELMGLNALPCFSIKLKDVRIPVENCIGGKDGHDFAPVLASSQVALAALAVGMARGAFEYSRDYAKQREVLGSMIAQKQSIAFMLAEMATEIEAIRLLNWEAAWMLDNGKEDANKAAYLALQGAMDMVLMVTDRGVQILGGYGYIREYPVEMWLRNGRGVSSLVGLAVV